MKKAYVKPVFLAEEFVAEMSVAACTKSSIYEALELERGHSTLCDQNCGHTIGGNGGGHGNHHLDDKYTHDDVVVQEGAEIPPQNNNTYWDYAQTGDNKVTLFSTTNYECDFLWSYEDTGTVNEVKVWGSTAKDERPNNGIFGTGWSLVQFFLGNSTSHGLGYNGTPFLS